MALREMNESQIDGVKVLQLNLADAIVFNENKMVGIVHDNLKRGIWLAGPDGDMPNEKIMRTLYPKYDLRYGVADGLSLLLWNGTSVFHNEMWNQ